MEEIIRISILIIAGIASGFINVMAGGGSAITLPILIFLGLDSATANGTNRIGILLQNISGLASYRQENYQDYPTSIKLSLWTLPGGILGAIFATKIDNETFNIILGLILIGMVVSMIIPKNKNQNIKETKKINITTYILMLGVGFYGGFIQVGVGILLMAILHNYLKMKLTTVNMHKLFVVLIYTIPALLIFIISGNINYYLGFALALGNSFGAWVAVKLSVRKGDKFVKIILILTILIMSIKLFGIF